MATEDTTPAAVPEAPVRLRRSLTTRQGRKVPRMLYRQQGPEPADDDPIVGLVDTPELAALIVAAVNRDIPAAAPDEGREPLILTPGEFAALRTVAEKLGMLPPSPASPEPDTAATGAAEGIWRERAEAAEAERDAARAAAASDRGRAKAAEAMVAAVRAVLLAGGQDAESVRRRAIAIVGTEEEADHG